MRQRKYASRNHHSKSERHIDEQIHLLADAIENCSELIAMADLEGYFIFANRAFLQALGYSKEEVIGKHFGSFYSENNPPALNREICEKVLQEGGWRGECLLSRRDGTDFPVLLSVGPSKNKQGRTIGSLGVARDIGDQKRANENLRMSEEQFRELAENIRETFFTCVLDPYRVTYLSPAFEEIWGRPRQEVYDRPMAWIDAILPEDREGAIRTLEQAQQGLVTTMEYRIMRPDGSVRWISARSSPIRDCKGKYCRIVGFAEDITKRKQMEAALKQSQERYRFLVENIPSVVWSADQEGKTQFISPNVERISGYTLQELYAGGERFRYELIHPDEAEKVKKAYQDLFRTHSFDMEYRIRSKDGHWSWVHDRAVSVFEKDGVKYAYGVLSDVTARKEAEIALRETLAKLSTALEETERQAQEARQLTELVDFLQSCRTVEEACRVIANSLPAILSSPSGAMCLTIPFQDAVEAVATWGDTLATKKRFTPNDCWALRRGKIHRVNDSNSSLPCAHASESPASRCVCVPLAAQGETLGLLYLEYPSASPNSTLESLVDLREAFDRQVIAVGERISLALANLKLREVLRNQSIRDALTGLFNRRYMEESLQRELSRAQRGNQHVSVMMLDLDHFKLFNDTFGHEAGDLVLREVANLLQLHVRAGDVASRFGGEEFVLIFPEMDSDAAHDRAELIRKELKALALQYRGHSLGKITISGGVAVFPEDGADAEALLHAADQALYRAKKEGRDRVVVASSANTESDALDAEDRQSVI